VKTPDVADVGVHRRGDARATPSSLSIAARLPIVRRVDAVVVQALAANVAPIYADGVHIRSSYVRQFASFIDVTIKARP